MMAPGKRARDKKNPYMLYCAERQQTEPHLKGMAMPDLVAACSDGWTAMPHQQRQRYVQQAKDINEGCYAVNPNPGDTNLQGRFDSFGRSLLAVQQNIDLKSCESKIE